MAPSKSMAYTGKIRGMKEGGRCLTLSETFVNSEKNYQGGMVKKVFEVTDFKFEVQSDL